MVFEMVQAVVTLYGTYVAVFFVGAWLAYRIRQRALAEAQGMSEAACALGTEEMKRRLR